MISELYRFTLTQKDECVAEGYIPLYDIFTQEKYALPNIPKDEWIMSEERLWKMRKHMYHELKKRAELCKVEDMAKFWNGNLNAINNLGINPFANILYFKEVANAMICFQSSQKNQQNDNIRKKISWGIKKDIYRKYYKSKVEELKNGESIKKVSLYDEHREHTGNMFKLPRVNVALEDENGEKRVIKLRRNSLYNQFEFWCKVKKITKTNAIYNAIALLMKENPVGELKELGAYERKVDLDYIEVLVPEKSVNDSVSCTIYIPKEIHMKMRQIIDNFNKDPDNIGKPTLSIPKYIIQAVVWLNKNANLKYSNPQLNEKIEKAKEAEEYNRKISKEY